MKQEPDILPVIACVIIGAAFIILTCLMTGIPAHSSEDIEAYDTKGNQIQPISGHVYQYTSHCTKNNTDCERRLKQFILDNAREPATDIEIVMTYELKNESELWDETPLPSETRLLKWP